MDRHRFLLEFPDITCGLREVRMVSELRGQGVHFMAGIDDAQLSHLSQNLMPSNYADAVDIAFAVAVADRLAYAPRNERRHIEVSLPVRDPVTMSSSDILTGLQDRLYDFTHDNWSFHFRRRMVVGRQPEVQLAFPHVRDSQVDIEVALWSGGLDATAGVYSRMKMRDSAGHFTLFGTGFNSFVLHRQQEVLAVLKTDSPKFGSRSVGLVQIPLLLSETTHLRKNGVPRARGFVFLLLGAVCAAMERQSRLNIYENGIGALNLPFSVSEVDLDHSRAVHPVLIRRMDDLASAILGTSVSYHNPFEFVTKAELCQVLVHDGMTRVVGETISCDRRRRAIPMQCGCCSSCLLRRQALAANGLVEPSSSYLVTKNLALAIEVKRRGASHLPAMLAQVADLQQDLESARPWMSLKQRYPDLGIFAEEIAKNDGVHPTTVQQHIMRLYSAYAAEWESVSQVFT